MTKNGDPEAYSGRLGSHPPQYQSEVSAKFQVLTSLNVVVHKYKAVLYLLPEISISGQHQLNKTGVKKDLCRFVTQ